jgi:hypothetical protein
MAFPPVFTDVWDITAPPDTQLANLLGQDIRNLKLDVMQRLSLLSGTLANRPAPEIANATWGGAGFGLLYFATDTGQIFQWSGAAWTDVTTSILRGLVVAKVDLLAQQANIAPTLLFTPTASGFFRVSGSVILTQNAVSSNLPQLQIIYTDPDSSVQKTVGISTLNNNNVVGEMGSQDVSAIAAPGNTIYAKVGVAINYQTINYNSGGGGPAQYALHIRLESLG